jgi:hypothetical protein
MRIPPSVIVMSVLTAVPFGLGIRDTLKHRDASADELGGFDFGGKRSAREQAELAAWEVEQAREAAEREAQNSARIAMLDGLYGPTPASMGKLLIGVTLGPDAFEPSLVRTRVDRLNLGGFVSVAVDGDETSVTGVEVTVRGEYEVGEMCDKLDEKLVAAWGKSTNGVWLDATTHQRAALDFDDCVLRFDRYLDSAEWVAQLPLSAIGAAPEKLMAQRPAATVDDDGASVLWKAAGVRYGKGASDIEAYLENGKVVGFKATVDTDFDSMLGVRDALSATLKLEPTKIGDESAGDLVMWQWKRRVPVALEQRGTGRISVMVGNTPWD